MCNSDETKKIWDSLAPWWDKECDEGDLYHRTFIFPTILSWVKDSKGKRILDLGCGNGALARLLAKNGASIVAVDFSETFIKLAKQRSKGLNIEYKIIDATKPEQLATLMGSGKFDYITCSMVLHDMPSITPLVASLIKLLNTEGAFIFSVPHPCFNSGLVEMQQLKDVAGQGKVLLPNRYINTEEFKLYSKPGQPIKQISFHRSLSMLFNELLGNGLVMSGFEEPVAADVNTLPQDYLWKKLSEIPPAIISRWKIG